MSIRPLLAAALAATLAGCASIAYYGQAANGHLSLLAAARPIGEWLDDPLAAEPLKQRLRRAREIRAFASAALGLPDNRSYTAYADLQRPAAVWNVFAAPELSLGLKTWCYPVLGCAGYRGYFDRTDAEAMAAELRAQGFDAYVAPVPAYSTLGWFDDPLLNTFIFSADVELARLVFHELAHQVVYVRDDTVFNESFATAVEREGVRRWLAAQGDDAQRSAWALAGQRREQFLALLAACRQQLAELYASPATDADKRTGKAARLEQLQRDYARLRELHWGGFAGYDRFFVQPPNNAQLAAVAAYNEQAPVFAALLDGQGGDLPRFYAEVGRLAALERSRRDAILSAIATERGLSSGPVAERRQPQ